ncbi:hypothetical protein CMK14_21960 [Candidatus Poribacteria bacterium]|nr:hypothetical protein [Candidatus Poribacteria bacterium]
MPLNYIFNSMKFRGFRSRMSSQAVEDYLKAIYKLQLRDSIVTTSALAEYLNVSPASAWE